MNLRTIVAGESLAIGAGLLFAQLALAPRLRAAAIFQDPNLESAVAASLGKAPDLVQAADLPGLTAIAAQGFQITNLSGLEGATNLEVLYLNENSIQDLTPLAGLKQLNALELEQNQITDLRPIRDLTNLSCLSLGGNPITNYWAVSNLTHLASFSVRIGSMKNLGPLRNLNSLQHLTLWRNGIVNISPLSGLTNLNLLDLRWNRVSGSTSSNSWPANVTSLYLGGNSLSNAPSLQQLGRLTLLDLEDNWIKDVSPLTNLTHLTYLALSRNPIANAPVLAGLSLLGSLELRGNALTDVSFLSALTNLTYADLAFNRITNVSGLQNVHSVVLANNPLSDFSQFKSLSQLTSAWLFEDTIQSADFLTSLPQLNYLNIEGAGLRDLSPVAGLTNLTGLAISRNLASDYAAISALTNLVTLRLESSALTSADCISNLSSLTFLSLEKNKLVTLSALDGLTNLHDLYLKRNELTIITNLVSLPSLADVDLSYNSLEICSTYPDDNGTNALPVILQLQLRRSASVSCGCETPPGVPDGARAGTVRVIYTPTNEPPLISAIEHWFVPCNSTSTLPIEVLQYPMPDTALSVSANTANPTLASVPDGLLPGTKSQRTLTVFSGCDPETSTTEILVGAADDVDLSNHISIQVTVVPDLNVGSLYPNANTNLMSAIAETYGTEVSELTVIDLLRSTSLGVEDLGAGDMGVWTWLTNLTSLYLAGSSITDINFITNLPHLSTLELDSTSVTNLKPLEALTELSSLRISFQPGLEPSLFTFGTNQLTSLDLIGDALHEVSFLTNLNQLVRLRLDDNYLTNAQALAVLTHLTSCSLQQNLLRDPTPLSYLTNLFYLDVRLNLLDLRDTSTATLVLDNLTNTWVEEDPQREPPLIDTPDRWFIAANSTSTVPVDFVDNAFYNAPISVTAASSNPALIPSTGLQLAVDEEGDWSLTCVPAAGQVGDAIVTVAATNDAGLWSSEVIAVKVLLSKLVDIPDPILHDVILDALDKGPPLTTVDLLDLTELDLISTGVTNLTGLEAATNLTYLVLDNNQIADLSPLANLSQLAWLSASNNLIEDISSLQNVATLNVLNLALNPITNYSPLLSGFVSITNLDLSGALLSDTGVLTNLVQLSVLNLNCDHITDGSQIASLSNLTSLLLRGNLLRDISFLTNLTQIETLDLSTNLIRDVSPLSGLIKISELDLQRNIITNIAPLSALAGDGYLGLELNELNFDADSAASKDLASLQESGFSISYSPQFPLDTDEDGMPDDWEIAYGLNPNDPVDAFIDPDGDGLPNLVEYALGTDPRNSVDGDLRTALSFISDNMAVYASLTFARRSTPQRLQYVPEVSDDGLNWSSDSSHVREIRHTAMDSEFDSVTVIDLTPVTQPGPRLLRLRVLSN